MDIRKATSSPSHTMKESLDFIVSMMQSLQGFKEEGNIT